MLKQILIAAGVTVAVLFIVAKVAKVRAFFGL